MTAPVQLIVDKQPQSGVWNMAVDAALLEESLRNGTTFVRLYRWSEATVSLGYFQKPEERLADARLESLPFVRRLTGGGAILHHHELTYSCSLPPQHPLAQQPYQLYREMHAVVIEVLSGLGIELTARGKDNSSDANPFLCFLREAEPDLVIRGHKVLGSAQRRRRGAVLQHGSLLLRASEHVPELRGLVDLVPNLEWPDGWESQIGARMALSLGQEVQTSDLPFEVRQDAIGKCLVPEISVAKST